MCQTIIIQIYYKRYLLVMFIEIEKSYNHDPTVSTHGILNMCY
jgi:hypothetical protein